MRTAALQLFETIKESSRKFGPYLLLELLLPGGTLFALALFAYRQQPKTAAYLRLARRALGRSWARAREWMAQCAVTVGRCAASWRMQPATLGCCCSALPF